MMAGVTFVHGSILQTYPVMLAEQIIIAHRSDVIVADLVKIFPADLLGGPYFIRQMQGPFPEVRFMVSGGVSLKNVAEYVRVGVTGICLGSAYLGNLLAGQGQKRFVKEMQQFVKRVTAAQKKQPTTGKSHR